MPPTRATPGTLSTKGEQMLYAHGQHAAYVLDRCKCDPCSASNRAYEAGRRGALEPAYISAGPAREHLKYLSANGVGWKTAAKTAGVPNGSVSKILYGDPKRGMEPSKRVRRSTSERLLAVMPSAARAGSLQPAGPTWVLIDEMTAAGVTKTAIARYLGQNVGGLQLSTSMIHHGNVVKVREMHRRWMSGDLVLTVRGHRNVPEPAVVAPPVRVPDYQDRSEILLDLAEVLEARLDQSWRQQAACRSRPGYLWFPARGDARTAAKAVSICRACMVRAVCLSANLHESDGIYGGVSAGERRQLRRDLVEAPVSIGRVS